MNEMKLYKTLQALTGELNALVVGLYNGDIDAADAAAQAKDKIDTAQATLAALMNQE